MGGRAIAFRCLRQEDALAGDTCYPRRVAPRLRGKYELLEVAGEGGMAQVFRGLAHGSNGFARPVAIKRVLDGFEDDTDFVEMFIEEARVSAFLHHPNIAQVHDFDRDEQGAFFLVMEWVPGVNLREWCEAHKRRGEPTPWPLTTAIGIEIAKALGSAHERRTPDGILSPIYHRDVTPQNVLLSEHGYVKLTDFGLARATDRARITKPHIVKGKVSFMAPELTEGSDASVQSDIYALGVLLWEVLLGRKLFAGEDPVELVRSIRAGKVPSVCDERPEIPQALMDAIARAVARKPEDRFRSARAMTRALANILRVTPESTGARVMSRSVRAATQTLAQAAAEGESPLPREAIPLNVR